MSTIIATFFAILLTVSPAICGSVSVCDGKYEVPMFDEASVLLDSEDMSCGAVIYVRSSRGLEHLYGFLSYREPIAEGRMKKFLSFVARFVNNTSRHDLGEFREGEPEFSVIPNKGIYTLSRNYEQVYKDAKFSGQYEIYARVEDKATNGYFIEYSHQDGRPEFYDKFKEWVLR